MIPTRDLTDEEDEADKRGGDKSNFVMKSEAVEIAKEVKRSDGW